MEIVGVWCVQEYVWVRGVGNCNLGTPPVGRSFKTWYPCFSYVMRTVRSWCGDEQMACMELAVIVRDQAEVKRRRRSYIVTRCSCHVGWEMCL